jgi:hypothetical protein
VIHFHFIDLLLSVETTADVVAIRFETDGSTTTTTTTTTNAKFE